MQRSPSPEKIAHKSPDSNILKDSFWRIGVDLLVIFSPLLVILLYSIRHQRFEGVFRHEEWLFVAIILFADSIIRLIRAAIAPGERRRVPMLFAIVLLLVVGFLGCSLFMADAMAAAEMAARKTAHVSTDTQQMPPATPDASGVHAIPAWMQWIYVCGAVAAFVWCSGVEYVSEASGRESPQK